VAIGTAAILAVVPPSELPLIRESFLRMQVQLPLALRVLGGLMLMCGLLGPFWPALRAWLNDGPVEQTRSSDPMPRYEAFAHGIGSFLLSANPVIGALVAAWLSLKSWSRLRDRYTLVVEPESEPPISLRPAA